MTEMKSFNVRLSPELSAKFNAALGDQVKNRVIRRLIEAWIAEQEARA